MSKNIKPKVNTVVLTDRYIQNRADEEGVTFNEMKEIINKELKPNKDNWCHYSGMPSPDAYNQKEDE